jgi:hypothetical protein
MRKTYKYAVARKNVTLGYIAECSTGIAFVILIKGMQRD